MDQKILIILIVCCMCLLSISSIIAGVYLSSSDTGVDPSATDDTTDDTADDTADDTVDITPRISLSEGEAVQCTTNDVGAGVGAVYRYTGNKLRHYSNTFIADSWDPNWRNPNKIDCKGQTMGTPIGAKLEEGKAIQCVYNDVGAGGGVVYRHTNNQLRPYPTETIADSWDPHWGSPLKIDCIGQTLGTPMAKKI